MSTKGKILVVDDELLLRDLLFEFFTSSGYAVEAVDGGRKAIDCLAKDVFDVALVDLRMPEMDGIQLAQAIRAIDADLPMIIMTAYPSFDSVVKALREKAYDYVIKPFRLPHLALIIERAVKECRLIRQNRLLTERLNVAEAELSRLRQ
ncbi:MAG: response regulator [Candidatus Latescibacteria bacterium]|nr:response regulator [Candidatus Latescibacterota bacterium]